MYGVSFKTQNPAVATPCGFDPRHRHQVHRNFVRITVDFFCCLLFDGPHYGKMISTNRKLVKIKMIINIDYDLKGSILDIGGGGEAIIGQVYGDRVTAIDNRQEELEEAPNCCTKLLMDAEKLSFFDGSFDNVTFFYALMYMSEETQRKAIFEATRVLKTGGIMCIWDCVISSAYPEPFVVDLDIQFTDKRIHTSYGIVKLDPQSSDSISQLLKNAGLNIVSMKEESGQFNITCRKD